MLVLRCPEYNVCAACLKELEVEWEGMSSRVEGPNSWYSGHVGSQLLLGVAATGRLPAPVALTQPNTGVREGRGGDIKRVTPSGHSCSRIPTNYPTGISRLTTSPGTYHLHMRNSSDIASA